MTKEEEKKIIDEICEITASDLDIYERKPMTKRKFRVVGERYGGELTVGTVSADFVRYWQDKDTDDLQQHLLGLEWQDEDNIDSDSPPVLDDGEEFVAWNEVDDLEHLTGYAADSRFIVSEITDRNDDWAYDENEKEFYPYPLNSRECYADEREPENPPEDSEYIPVLMWYSAEKGNFGTWFVETDGEDFNPKKFAISYIETNLGEMAELAYYDKVPIDCEYDFAESVGKGYYAFVGWMNKKWHDTEYSIGNDDVWEGYEDNLREE